LENAEEFEELDDDFVSLANKELLDNEEGEREGEEFEFEDEDDEFGSEEGYEERPNKVRFQYEDDEDVSDEGEFKQHVQLRNRDVPDTQERSLFDARFEEVLKSYDDDEIGELQEDDPNIQGKAKIENLTEILDQFLSTQDSKVPKQKDSHKAFENNSEEDTQQEHQQEEPEGEEEEEFEIVELEEEEEDKWDCESILSTYSNHENHPAIIIEPLRNIHQIKLSSKTGLPVNVLPSKPQMKSQTKKKTPTPIDIGNSKPKEETPEEKKIRKKLVKEERKAKRINKKALKIAYKNEEVHQQHLVKTNPTIQI